MADVFANSRSILHKGDGNQHVSGPPDVCKTPSPGGPVPIPYPNIAMDSDLAKGTKKVKINGQPVATEAANLSTSTGDEAGTAGGGIISSKTKGKLTWGSASTDVKAEGNGVARFMDVAQHNGNTFNTALVAPGSPNTGAAYADDFTGPCPICNAGPRKHRIVETTTSAKLCKDVLTALHNHFNGLSNSQKKKWGTFMVGVMICKCTPGKAFFAKSGKPIPDVTTVAGGVAGIHKAIPDGPVGVGDLLAANKSALASPAKKSLRIGQAWEKAQELADNRVTGYNPPGNCAAAKLLTKADGHAPLEMTEMFFDPSGSWTGHYDWRMTEVNSRRYAKLSQVKKKAALQNKQAQMARAKRFGVGDTVASCHTCQMLLYMSNCPERTC